MDARTIAQASIRRSMDTRKIEGQIFDHKRLASPGAFFAWMREHGADTHAANHCSNENESWANLGGQGAKGFYSRGVGENALRQFKGASAALMREREHRSPDADAAPIGSRWVIPDVIMGLPLPARYYPHCDLPPVRVHLSPHYSASVNGQAIAAMGAKLARALWDYQIAGGTVDLSVSLLGYYSGKRVDNGARGLWIDVSIPLTSQAAISTGLSTSFYRVGFISAISEIFSPLHGDCVPINTPSPKGAIAIEAITASGDVSGLKGIYGQLHMSGAE